MKAVSFELQNTGDFVIFSCHISRAFIIEWYP